MRFSTNKPELQHRTCCSTFKGPVLVIMDETRRELVYPAQLIIQTIPQVWAAILSEDVGTLQPSVGATCSHSMLN